MNTIEDSFRAATKAAADTVAPGSAPPLKLPDVPEGRGWLRRARFQPGGWPGWLAPVAAAAAVAIVVATSLVIAGSFHGTQRASTSVAPAQAGVPPYYVALRFSSHNRCCDTPKTRAVVVNTATGAVLATIAPPKPYVTFAGVSGAGDDRSFVVAAQRNLNQPVTRFFLLRINPAAHPGERARLTPLPVPADKSGLLSFALSPDGASLAVAGFGNNIQILNVSTGAQRTWHPGLGGGFLGTATTDALFSWSADSRKLAFAFSSDTNDMGAYLLDPRLPGSNLLKNSRLLVHAPKPGTNATPWYQVRLTSDGRTVIAVLAARAPKPNDAAQKLQEFSARTGKLLRVVNYLPVYNFTNAEQVLWQSPSGHTLLIANTKPYSGKRRSFFLLGHVGLLTGHQFTPLPWFTDTLAAAW